MKRHLLPQLTLITGLIIGSTMNLNAQTFSYTGSVQTFTVPSGVTSLTIDASGATGGVGYNFNAGGAGGRVQCNMAVTSGQVLYIYVGGVGAAGVTTGGVAGGWNGGANSTSFYGAGGGGASDIRSGGTALSNRVMVAAGGGGGAYNCSSGMEGGYGGGLTGEAGYTCSSNTSLCSSGGGGTQTSGGVGGTCYGASSGTLGAGGAGATYGGGGGGGFYGGSGGGYGGAGGGSSYTNPSVITGITLTSGYNTSGNGSINISTCSLPSVGVIGGTTTVMVAASQTLTDATPGGVWSSSNTAVATVGTSGVYTGISAGTAVISYAVTNSCGTTTVNTTVTVTTSTLGISNLPVGSNVNVYPNPSTGMVNIQWNAQKNTNNVIKVTDITGREVYSQHLHANTVSGTKQIDLSVLTNGLYMISVKGDNMNYSGKLLLQK